MSFYTFRQNNSGGSIDVDDLVGQIVIIEADSAESANQLAEMKAGIYFDGRESGQDCSCCGDRWYRVSEHDGAAEPMVYSTPLAKHLSFWRPERAHVYYADGRHEVVECRAMTREEHEESMRSVCGVAS